MKVAPVALGAAALLTACGGGGGATSGTDMTALESKAVDRPAAAAHGAQVSELAQDLTQRGVGLDRSKLARFKEVARSMGRKPGQAGEAEATQVSLTYFGSGNWFRRVISSSAEQSVIDENGLRRYVDRRQRASNGTVAHWSVGGDPSRQTDYHFNGTGWLQCGLQQGGVSTAFDADGVTQYDYCDKLDVGSGKRTAQDIGGRAMLEVYDAMRAANATNIFINNAPAVLGAATFPAGATLVTQVNTPSHTAYAYYPGAGNMVRNPIPALVVADPEVCRSISGSTPVHTYTSFATTLESMVETHLGNGCIYQPGPPAEGGPHSGPRNEWWTQATVGLGILGNLPPVQGNYYTGNTPLRAAFSGGNSVSYYACAQRFDGAVRNCNLIGSGAYAIEQAGDARVMRLSGAPQSVLNLPYEPLFVERGGKVYHGYKNDPVPASTARFDLAGLNALAAQLGLPLVDPEVPLQPTRGSYAGDWVLGVAGSLDSGDTLSVRMLPDLGTIYCTQDFDNIGLPCTLVSLDDAGSFRITTPNDNIVGTFRLVEGTASGTLFPPAGSTAPAEPMEGRRR